MQNFADFRAYIGKLSNWKEKATSQAKLKILQLEPAWLGLITNVYISYVVLIGSNNQFQNLFCEYFFKNKIIF